MMNSLQRSDSVRPQGWGAQARDLSPTSLRQLLASQIPAIVIRGFASAEECDQLVRAADKLGFEPYRQVEPPIQRIGVTVFEYDSIGMDAYFRQAAALRELQDRIFAASFNPLRRLMDKLSANHSGQVGIATDPTHGQYYAGLVRRIEDGTLLHIDFAAAEQPDWTVASVRAQLAWNLYVDLADGAGDTHVYDRPWNARDEQYKIADSYGYRHEVIVGANRYTYRPRRGDVCIFNTRNFHEVDPSKGKRVTFTSAIGRFDDDSLRLWS